MSTIKETAHDHMKMGAVVAHDNRTQSLISTTGRFIWHLVQMILAMEAGMMIYHLLLGTVLSGTGYAALTQEYRLLGYWMMVIFMTLPMIALMRFYHKSAWRNCAEMAIAMLAPLAVLTVLVLCTLFPIHTLYGVGDPVMILAMAAFMLIRPGQHSHGRHEHASHPVRENSSA